MRQTHHWRDRHQTIASALFGRRNGNLLPMFYTLNGTNPLQAQYTSFGGDRLKRRNAKFDRFLDNPVHFVARRQSLHQCQAQRRLPVYLADRLDSRARIAPQTQQFGLRFAAFSIEKNDTLARTQPENALGVMRKRLGQCNFFIGQGQFCIKESR